MRSWSIFGYKFWEFWKLLDSRGHETFATICLQFCCSLRSNILEERTVKVAGKILKSLQSLWRSLDRDNPQSAKMLSRRGTVWRCTCWIADNKGYGWRAAKQGGRAGGRMAEGRVRWVRAGGDEEARREKGDKMWRSWTARHGAAPSRRVYWSQGAERFNLPLATVRAMLPSGARQLARRPRWCSWTPARSAQPSRATHGETVAQPENLSVRPGTSARVSLAEVDWSRRKIEMTWRQHLRHHTLTSCIRNEPRNREDRWR